MKMTRHDLKGLVKECLVEILSEGLTETSRTINENKNVQARTRQPEAQPVLRRPNIADKISFLPNKSEIRQNQANQPAVQSQNLARSLTSDPVLADIFADTARSGAHRQMNESSSVSSHEHMVAASGDAAAKAMLRSDPTDIFGESAEKWAALAFAEKMPGKF
jgi:hypothetical protein